MAKEKTPKIAKETDAITENTNTENTEKTITEKIANLKEKLENTEDAKEKEDLEKQIAKETDAILSDLEKEIERTENIRNKITITITENNKSISITENAQKTINDLLKKGKLDRKYISYNSTPNLYNSMYNFIQTFSDRFYIVNK